MSLDRSSLGVTGGVTVAKLFDSTLSGTATAIDTGASGIATGHDILEVYALLRTDEAAVRSTLSVTVNGDGGSNYDRQFVRGVNATASAAAGAAEAGWLLTCAGASLASGVFTVMRFTVPFYTQTTAQKAGEYTGGDNDTTIANRRSETQALHWRSTAAITQMTFNAPAAKNFIAGSRLLIFGR
jgi:hypothetical protein